MACSKDDIEKASTATGDVAKYVPYEYNFGQGGIKWLEPTDSQLQIDHGWELIDARDALWLEMILLRDASPLGMDYN